VVARQSHRGRMLLVDAVGGNTGSGPRERCDWSSVCGVDGSTRRVDGSATPYGVAPKQHFAGWNERWRATLGSLDVAKRQQSRVSTDTR
jgi:hypothetical protein